MRVTHQSVARSVLSGLQGNINKLGEAQHRLSTGKLISRPSDSPAGTVSAMELRSQIAANKQYARNADDGLGWLAVADNALQASGEQVTRARNLVLQGLSTGSNGSPETRNALAAEIDEISKALMGFANTTYLDRPVFGGTTAGASAFNTSSGSYGTFSGDEGEVYRTVGADSKVRVDVPGKAAFSTAPDVTGKTAFEVLSTISAKLRGYDPGPLGDELANLDAISKAIQTELAAVGSRYNQLERMRQAADDAVISLTTSLSDVESIDLPKTITELQLQQTAYQAALAAGARVVQPSLVDFLR